MEIKITSVDMVQLLDLHGRLDTTHYTAFEKMLMETIDQGNLRIVIDLAQLDYISSSGLRIFLMGLKRITTRGGKMALCNLRENIEGIFKIAGFNTIFTIFKEREDAIAYCAS